MDITGLFDALSDEIFAATVTLLFGYTLWQVQRWVERRHRRKDYATALLVELWSVDWVLRGLYLEKFASLAYGKFPMQLLDDVRVAMEFPQKTMFNLLLFRGLCDDIRIVMARSREHLPMGDQLTMDSKDRDIYSRRNFSVRSKAGFALQLVPELKRQLEAVGGEWNEDRPQIVEVIPPNLPEIPQSPFKRDRALSPKVESG